MPAAAARGRWGAVAYALAGGAIWLGATVRAAAVNDDPSDPTPILRTFAVGGGLFFGPMFAAVAASARRRAPKVSDELYRRLAVGPVPEGGMRAAVRRTVVVRYVYTGFGAVTTGLVLTAVGLGEDGPFAALMYAAGALVVVWVAVGLWAFGQAFKGADQLVRPLGLRLGSVPVPGPPHGRLHGAAGYKGTRYGRPVAIGQATNRAVTTVAGSFRPVTLTDPEAIAAVAGEDPAVWRRVRAEAGPDGVTVERRGNGAGRFVLYDLFLAEQLAAG